MVMFSMACNQKIDLPHFDEEIWQADIHGCLGDRKEMVESLLDSKKHIQGLNEDEVIHILGKPDRNQLYRRNQKFYIYDITGSEFCASDPVPYTYLNIRFNATGLAKEVMVYQGKSAIEN